MGALRPGMRLRRCARRTGFGILTPTRPKCKRPRMGPFTFWRRGRDGRSAPGHATSPLRPSNRVRNPYAHSAQMQKAPNGAFHILAERAGWALCARACDFAAAPVEQGSESLRPLGPNAKGPEWGLSHSGGEGGMGALRPGMRLRRCARRTGFGILTPTRPKCKRPRMGPFTFWRRGRDSNPRYAINVHSLSKRAP